MKRIMLLIFLLGLILLSSCNGFQKVNEFSFETIYSDEKIIIKVNDIEWNPGLSKVGGAELRTKKTQQEFMQLLEKQGVNFIWEDLLSSTNIFQINHEGLWSISFKNEENYMQVLIREMSVYIKNDVSIPFPLYPIFFKVFLAILSISIFAFVVSCPAIVILSFDANVSTATLEFSSFSK